jgi:hypothetical protein
MAIIRVWHQIVCFVNHISYYSEVGKLVLQRMCICRDLHQGTAKSVSRSTIICILNRCVKGLVSDTGHGAGACRWAVGCNYVCFVSTRHFLLEQFSIRQATSSLCQKLFVVLCPAIELYFVCLNIRKHILSRHNCISFSNEGGWVRQNTTVEGSYVY